MNDNLDEETELGEHFVNTTERGRKIMVGKAIQRQAVRDDGHVETSSARATTRETDEFTASLAQTTAELKATRQFHHFVL